jgi:hypothetical protein
VPPIVYCETNWIVALAFPHHQSCGAATKLRADAARGACRLRVPVAALMEARGPLDDVSRQVSRAFALLRDDLARAVQNGWPSLATLATTFQSSKDVDDYARRNAFAILQTLEQDPNIKLLDNVAESISVLHELRPKVRLQGKDVVDLYFLAAVLHDRRSDRDGPAVFFSANKKEFGPSGKVPPDIYDTDKILWREDFNLSSALGAWNAEFGRSPPE